MAFPDGHSVAQVTARLPEVDEVLQRVETLPEGQLDTLPFGMIQLDRAGKILRFNRTEGELARLDPRSQVGKNFFDQVAPCTRVKEFQGRFEEGLRRRSLYETFGFVFKFAHGWRNVAITLMYSEKTDSVWVLVSQAEAKAAP
jgi:photoactive yellow protein